MLDSKGGQLPLGSEGNLDVKVRLVKAGEGHLEGGGWGQGCVYCGRGSGGGALEDVPTEEVWGVAVTVVEVVEVEVTTVARAEVTGWDAAVPAGTTVFLAVGVFTIVCSCC